MTKFFLIQKYLDGKTSPREEQQLLDWVKENNTNKQQYIDQITSWNKIQGNKNLTKSNVAFKKLAKRLNITPSLKEKTYPFRSFLKYAAIFVVAVSSIYFFNTSSTSNTYLNPRTVSLPVEGLNDDQIVLQKEDGTENIIDAEEMQLSYLSSNTSTEKLSYNTLTIPRGKVFKIILSDGTKVWLNAESKIRFPEKFLKQEDTRTVYLEGEAFFDVSHNKKQPFIVKSGKLEIKVLGTKFNVSSYASEENISTTLVDGSVQIGNSENEFPPVLLKPNDQANYEKSSLKATVSRVNTNDYTAWIDKRIVFRNETFKNIATRIERTYNVNINNDLENFEQQRFTGEFDIETIEDILKTLKEIANFQYKIKGRNINIY